MVQVRAIDHLSPSDHDLSLSSASAITRLAPFRCVHHAFEHHARMQPDAIAVEHTGQKITYAQLDRSANTLAVKLRVMGVRPRNSRLFSSPSAQLSWWSAFLLF